MMPRLGVSSPASLALSPTAQAAKPWARLEQESLPRLTRVSAALRVCSRYWSRDDWLRRAMRSVTSPMRE